MKGRFSKDSASYLKYRPDYPPELITFIKSQGVFTRAWDCGCGNGQLAIQLAEIIPQVWATDISAQQLAQATQHSKVRYKLAAAEQSGFPENYFDLVTVAQAVHWFDFEKFFAEVKRVAKNNALILLVGYGLIRIDNGIDNLVNGFYKNVVGSYWDAERKFIDDSYRTIPFPFKEEKFPAMKIQRQWTLQDFEGHIRTWSAVKNFEKARSFDPVPDFINSVLPYRKREEKKEVCFPLFARVGRIEK